MSFLNKMLRKILKASPVLLDLARGIRDRIEFSAPPRLTPHGFKIRGPRIMQLGAFEAEELQLVRARSADFHVFINVGANIGYFALLAVTLGKRVMEIEASPRNAARLMENLALNNARRVSVFPVACGERVGIMEMIGSGGVASLVPGWSGSSHHSSFYVPFQCLDDLVPARHDNKRSFFLIDVEGFELEVPRGASRLLASTPKPAWLVEVSLEKHQPDKKRAEDRFRGVISLFAANGYRFQAVGASAPCSDPAAVATAKDLSAFRGIRNFLFEE
jgi:FkbM family methyltransferase